MRFPSFLASRALAACALLAFTVSAVAAPGTATAAAARRATQDKKEAKVSDAEAKLVDKMVKAPDAASRLTAAEEFAKKFPKSSLRAEVVEKFAAEISAVPDAAQKITLAERYMELFKGAGEGERLTPALVEWYVAAERFDDAFRVGSAWLSKNPNDVRVLSTLSFHAISLAQRNNPKFIAQGQPYGVKAIELLEAGTRPADMTDSDFQEFKTSWLPQLYQTQGLVALVSGNTADAVVKLQKAVSLKPADPVRHRPQRGVREDGDAAQVDVRGAAEDRADGQD
jgi:hypothetical protein